MNDRSTYSALALVAIANEKCFSFVSPPSKAAKNANKLSCESLKFHAEFQEKQVTL